jgi:GH15 family glucan-1,4-alpha-glucosidase
VNATRFPTHVLRDYAMLADGERGIVVGPRGEYVWMCAPSWDSEAVFAALVGGEGLYAVTPEQTPFVWGGHYEPGSLIWRSRWVTGSQMVECREALAVPADPGTAVILRSVEAIDGATRVQVVLDPRAGFGRHRVTHLHRRDDGVWTARCGPLHVRWSGAPDAIRAADGGLEAVIDVDGGGHHDLMLEISENPLRSAPPDADVLWRSTESAWERALPPITGTIADRDARHAYAVLCGMTSHSGGMVASATMCLPERAEAGRNYDYRYAWIRDQCYAGQAVAALGPHPLLDETVGFVADRLLEDGPGLRPAYTARGGTVPDERDLDLPGYPGGRTRIGNHANKQFQLDAFGEALLLFAAAAGHDRLDAGHWRAVETAANATAERGGDPDAGIWELDERRWTHSRLTCVAGLRAISRHAPAAQAARWSSLADRILSDTGAECLHPTGRWQRSPKDERIDSALVMPAIRGALAPDDPRTRATLDAVIDELTGDEFVYRFRIDDLPLGEGEGAFLLCGFAVSLALHQQGDEVRANRWFERSRSACGSPGLLAQEYDVEQRQLRGNLPQAFVHAMLLETAVRLAGPLPATTGETREEDS